MMTTDLPCGCVERLGPTSKRRTWSGACFGSGTRFALVSRVYRYALWRCWDDRPLMLFAGCNPSTADEYVLDNTLRRVEGFAKKWGHGGFVVVNAFALRSTDPRALLADPSAAVGQENDAHLVALRSAFPARVMVGWGANLAKKSLRFRRAELRVLLGDDVQCWGVIASGDPEHPLYIPRETEPRRYEWAETGRK
jgi:hypothetical protein